MEIIGFEKLSLVDYPMHTACTLFTGGCNFRCPFCHNGDLVLRPKSFEKQSVDEIFAYLEKRKGLLDGVVISGGEPTLQKDLADFAEKIKSIGYDIKLDTNGTNPEVIATLVERKLIDYIAVDVKSSKSGYSKAIGLKGFPVTVAQTVDYLKGNPVDYEFRMTLVDELVTAKDIEQTAEWLEGAKVIYLQKFIERDGCIKKGLNEVPFAVASQYAEIFLSHGIDARLRNYD